MQENDNKEKLLFGIKGAPGICIGKAYLVDKGVSVLPKFAIPKKKLGAEKKRFKAAVKRPPTSCTRSSKTPPRSFASTPRF